MEQVQLATRIDARIKEAVEQLCRFALIAPRAHETGLGIEQVAPGLGAPVVLGGVVAQQQRAAPH